MKFVTDESYGKVRRVLSGVIGITEQANSLGTVPSGATIKKVVVGITTVYDGSATIDIGHATDADAYMANTLITEGTVGTYTAYPNATLTADTAVLATVAGGTITTGAAMVEIHYEI